MKPFESRNWPSILPACLLIVVLPFTHTVALRLWLLAAAFGIAVWTWRREAHPAIPARNLLLAWAAFALASLAWSTDFEYSNGEVVNEIGYAMAAYFGFFALTRTEEDLRRILLALIITTGLASAFAIGRFVWHDDWLVGRSIGIGDRNAFSTTASFASIGLMLVLANVRLSPVPIPIAWGVFVLAFVAASLTLNRTMWPALGAATIVFLLGHHAGHLGTGRNRVAAVLLIVLVGAISTTQFLLASKIKRSEESERMGVVTAVMKDERIQIWKYALRRAADRPWYGYGYGRGILRKDFRARMDSDLAWHAHNAFLNHAISLGIPGLACFCLLLAALAAAFIRLIRQGDALVRSLGAFGLALLSCMIVRGLADDTLVRENALLFWSLTGMTLGAGTRRLNGSAGLEKA